MNITKAPWDSIVFVKLHVLQKLSLDLRIENSTLVYCIPELSLIGFFLTKIAVELKNGAICREILRSKWVGFGQCFQ